MRERAGSAFGKRSRAGFEYHVCDQLDGTEINDVGFAETAMCGVGPIDAEFVRFSNRITAP